MLLNRSDNHKNFLTFDKKSRLHANWTFQFFCSIRIHPICFMSTLKSGWFYTPGVHNFKFGSFPIPRCWLATSEDLIPVSTYREKNIPVRVSDLGLQTKEIWERSGGFCMKVRFFVVMKQVHRVENRSVHRRDTPVACKNSGNKIVLACHLLLLQFKTRA